MKKIPTIFLRDPDNPKLVTDECHPECLWVLKGEGRATRKWDGTCCMVRDGKLYKRREIKPGQVAPADFEESDFDRATGKYQGWVPVGDGPEDCYHREAFGDGGLPDGTYELLGPKVQGNPEECHSHQLLAHGTWPEPDAPRTWAELREWLSQQDIEGVVWHHPDGRMAKIKKRDFGLRRKP